MVYFLIINMSAVEKEDSEKYNLIKIKTASSNRGGFLFEYYERLQLCRRFFYAKNPRGVTSEPRLSFSRLVAFSFHHGQFGGVVRQKDGNNRFCGCKSRHRLIFSRRNGRISFACENSSSCEYLPISHT